MSLVGLARDEQKHLGITMLLEPESSGDRK
jgi:hypothetical protein